MTTKAEPKKEVMIPDGYAGFDIERIQLIRDNFAKGASFNELKLFLQYAGARGLDPISRQIIFVKYKTKSGDQIAFITSIDGYRLCADRTNLYAGNDDYLFDAGLTEFEHLQVHADEKDPRPVTATATIYKIVGGQRVPFSATARWNEYYPGDLKGHMWRKMPYLMLGKCAEALALRKGFPQELSGMYTDTEMEQAKVLDQRQALTELGYEVDDQSDAGQGKEELVYEDEPTTNGNGRPYVTPEDFFAAMGKMMNIVEKENVALTTEETNVGFVAGIEHCIKKATESMQMTHPDDIKYADWITSWRYVVTERVFGPGKRSSKDMEDYEIAAGIRWINYQKVEDEWLCSDFAIPEMVMLIKLIIDENKSAKGK